MNNTTHDSFLDYRGVIRDLASVAGDIAEVENTKAAAVSDNQHRILDDCIQEEQALLLKLRGLEQRRIRLQKELGWDSMTLQQIMDIASQEQAEVLNPIFQKLDQQLRRLQTAREAAEQILKVKLHQLEVYSQTGASYDNGGNVSQNSLSKGQRRIRSTYV